MQGVENVYTQHTPLLVNTLEMLLKGRLKDAEFASSTAISNGVSGPHKPAKLVVVFVVGGTTYEEAKAVADLNVQVTRAFAVRVPGSETCHYQNLFLSLQPEQASNVQISLLV